MLFICKVYVNVRTGNILKVSFYLYLKKFINELVNNGNQSKVSFDHLFRTNYISRSGDGHVLRLSNGWVNTGSLLLFYSIWVDDSSCTTFNGNLLLKLFFFVWFCSRELHQVGAKKRLSIVPSTRLLKLVRTLGTIVARTLGMIFKGLWRMVRRVW